jgi:hypothetical protein
MSFVVVLMTIVVVLMTIDIFVQKQSKRDEFVFDNTIKNYNNEFYYFINFSYWMNPYLLLIDWFTFVKCGKLERHF